MWSAEATLDAAASYAAVNRLRRSDPRFASASAAAWPDWDAAEFEPRAREERAQREAAALVVEARRDLQARGPRVSVALDALKRALLLSKSGNSEAWIERGLGFLQVGCPGLAEIHFSQPAAVRDPRAGELQEQARAEMRRSSRESLAARRERLLQTWNQCRDPREFVRCGDVLAGEGFHASASVCYACALALLADDEEDEGNSIACDALLGIVQCWRKRDRCADVAVDVCTAVCRLGSRSGSYRDRAVHERDAALRRLSVVDPTTSFCMCRRVCVELCEGDEEALLHADWDGNFGVGPLRKPPGRRTQVQHVALVLAKRGQSLKQVRAESPWWLAAVPLEEWVCVGQFFGGVPPLAETGPSSSWWDARIRVVASAAELQNLRGQAHVAVVGDDFFLFRMPQTELQKRFGGNTRSSGVFQESVLLSWDDVMATLHGLLGSSVAATGRDVSSALLGTSSGREFLETDANIARWRENPPPRSYCARYVGRYSDAAFPQSASADVLDGMRIRGMGRRQLCVDETLSGT